MNTIEAPEPMALLREVRAERINITRRHVAQILRDALAVGRMTHKDVTDIEERATAAEINLDTLGTIVEKLSKHFELSATVPDVAKLWSDHLEQKQALADYDAATRALCDAVYQSPRSASRPVKDIEADVANIHVTRGPKRRPLVAASNRTLAAWQDAEQKAEAARRPRTDVEDYCNKLRGR